MSKKKSVKKVKTKRVAKTAAAVKTVKPSTNVGAPSREKTKLRAIFSKRWEKILAGPGDGQLYYQDILTLCKECKDAGFEMHEVLNEERIFEAVGLVIEAAASFVIESDAQ